MEILVYILIFVLGMCLGSFVNMLVYRVAVKYGLKKPKFEVKNKDRSFCDGCGRQLKWYENIPIVSWIIQKGKTRCCQKKLPILYPIVEIITGLLFLIYEIRFMIYESNLILWILGLVIITLLVFLTIFDLKYLILPDFAVVFLAITAVVMILLVGLDIKIYLLSAIGSSLFLLILNLITRGKGMGWGDVKLAVFMGLFFGWPKILVAMYVAFIVGLLWG